jgi:hypothetical protein
MFHGQRIVKHFYLHHNTKCFTFALLFIKFYTTVMAAKTKTEEIRASLEKQLATKTASRTKTETTHNASVAKTEAAHQASRGKAEEKFKSSLTQIDTEIKELENLLAGLPRA